MKKIFIFLVFFFFSLVLVSAETSYNFVTVGLGNTLWCRLNGNCLINSLTVQNLTVEGDFMNVTVTDYNVTNNLNVEGSIITNNLEVNGSAIFNGSFETPCLHCEDGDIYFHGDGFFEGNVTAPNIEVMESLIVHGNSTCSGTATACGDIVDSTLCGWTFNTGQRGCRWRLLAGDCIGAATACENMSTATCEEQHVCTLTTGVGFVFGASGFEGNVSFLDNVNISGNLNVDGNVTADWVFAKFNITSRNNYIEIINGNQVIFNESMLETIYYNATSAYAIAGNIDAGTIENTQHPDGNYDGITLNISETAGSPGLDMRVNFTNITTFNKGYMRYYTSDLSGDLPQIQLWDYDDGEWESGYGSVDEVIDGYYTISGDVLDSSNHVQDGVVQMRLYKESNGNNNNKYYIDMLAIVKGYATPSGNVDLTPYWRQENSEETGNFTTSGILTVNKTYIKQNLNVDGNANFTGYLNVSNNVLFGKNQSTLGRLGVGGEYSGKSYLDVGEGNSAANEALITGAGRIDRITTNNVWGFQLSPVINPQSREKVYDAIGMGLFLFISNNTLKEGSEVDGIRASVYSTTPSIHNTVGSFNLTARALRVVGANGFSFEGVDEIFNTIIGLDVSPSSGDSGFLTDILSNVSYSAIIRNPVATFIGTYVTNNLTILKVEKPTAGTDYNFQTVLEGTGDGTGTWYGGTNGVRVWSESKGNLSINGSVGINTKTPLYPLTVYGNYSGISIWSEGNMSAPDFETRTSVFEGDNPFEFIHTSDYYKREDGSIDHTKFRSGTYREVPDYSRPFYVNHTYEECHIGLKCNVSEIPQWAKESQDSEVIQYYKDKYCWNGEICINVTEKEVEYPYTKLEGRMSISDEINILREAVAIHDSGLKIINADNNTKAVRGEMALFDEYVTNTTKDTATINKIQDMRTTIEDKTLIELASIIINEEGRLSDTVINFFNLGSDIGSYNLEKIAHYSFAMNIFLLWENLKQQKEINELENRLDTIESDLCSQGYTKYC